MFEGFDAPAKEEEGKEDKKGGTMKQRTFYIQDETAACAHTRLAQCKKNQPNENQSRK